MSKNVADLMPFSKLMGIDVVSAEKQRIEAQILVREDLCTTGSIMHGGALMAFADTLGAIGAFLNLPEGAAGTTTIESKTNFLAAAPEGDQLTAETTPVSVGRRISVWQTSISRADGRKVAVITQTQLVL